MANQADKEHVRDVEWCVERAADMPDEAPWIDRVSLAAGPGMACWHDGEAFVAVTGIGEVFGVSPCARETAS